MQVEVVGGAGDQAGLREPRQRVRDRRALGRDELAEQPVGERQRQPDPGRLDPAPARGQVPQQQHQADLEPRLAGDRPQRRRARRRAGRRGAAALRTICGHGRTRSANSRVEQRQPGRPQRAPRRRSARAAHPARGPSGCSRSPGADAARPPCGRRPGSRARSGRRGSAARSPSPAASNQGARSHAPDRRAEHPRGRELPGGDAHARMSNSSARSSSASSRYVYSAMRLRLRRQRDCGWRRPPQRSSAGQPPRSSTDTSHASLSSLPGALAGSPTRRVYAFSSVRDRTLVITVTGSSDPALPRCSRSGSRSSE